MPPAVQGPKPAGDFQALRRRAIEAMQARRFDEALVCASQAIALHPGASGMASLRADAFAALGRHEEALRAYERALELKPGQPKVLFNRGRALAALHRRDEAIECFRQALALNPRYAQALNGLGHALQLRGRYEEAIGHYEGALRERPDDADALNGRGTALKTLGRYREAIEDFDRVLALRPGLAKALWNKGTTLLHLGLTREAWLLYDHRLQTDRYAKLPAFGLPALGAGPLEGRKVLVQWEARFGDVIQMLRYLPALQAAAEDCWLQMAPPLRGLAARSFPRARIVGVDEAGEADCRVPYTSLPLAMGTFSEQDIPAAVPYLVPDPLKAEHWRHAIPALGADAPRIGLAWRGNPVPAHRSASLEALRPLLETPRAQFVTLQKNLSAAERAALQGMKHVALLDEELASFDDTAAVIAGLDLVITVDSVVAHLAGALGRPVWMLLKLGADWRWMAGRDDTPWYPSARLFRQARLDDWEPVVRGICAELRRFAAREAGRRSGVPAAALKQTRKSKQ